MYDILSKNGIDPSQGRLVRHGNKELDVLETFRANPKRFNVYQSFQGPQKRFGNAKHISVFAPLDGTAAIFLGLWDVVSCTDTENLTKAHLSLIDQYGFPEVWKKRSVFYELKNNLAMHELSERLVIDWGRGTLAWIQRSDKPVLEIRRPNSIGDFASYSDVKLNFYDLKKLMDDANSNVTWRNALSSVNGVYLIRDTTSGKLYVGSAYGEQGIYGRWRSYASSGHGGDVMLRDLDHSHFEFSILEIAPLTLSAQEIIDIENKWKDRLGSRLFGNLNSMEGSRPIRERPPS